MPALTADAPLRECLRSLENQSISDFEVIVIDNSGKQLVPADAASQVIYNDQNAGFGGAVNQGIRASNTPFVATLNDDAVADPRWLEALLNAIEQRYEIGMCASQVRLDGERLDSAGMLICSDGSSKQRGHLEPPSSYGRSRKYCFRARRQPCTGATCWTRSGCSTRAFSCIARIRIWACGRAGRLGNAATWPKRLWSIATRTRLGELPA